MTLMSIIFTILYFFLLRWITKPLIFGSIFSILGSGILFTVLIGYKASTLLVGTNDYIETVAASVAIGIGTLIFFIIIVC
jgi:hypothetical protein